MPPARPFPYIPDYRAQQEILARGADFRAQQAIQSGNMWAGVLGQVGQAVGQIVQERQEKKAAQQLAKQDAALMAYLQNEPNPTVAGLGKIVDPRRSKDIFEGLAAAQKHQNALAEGRAISKKEALETARSTTRGVKSAGGPGAQSAAYGRWRGVMLDLGIRTPEELPEQYDPESAMQAIASVEAELNPAKEAKTREVTITNPDGSKTTKIVEDVPGQDFNSAAPPKPTHLVTTTDAKGRPVQRMATEEELAAGVPVYQKPERADDEPLVAIMGPDGQPVFAPRSQAVGKRPASTREQGRPVTSGDANRIADLDTSMKDLDVLKKTLGGNHSTGILAQAGAALPNVVTEVTGLGTDAKSKQATIDRVKQVIGKAFEGGVLRKEDEAKYEKILPTIKDPPEIVTAKLAGLDAAVRQRRQTTLDALADAGYDVGRYQKRAEDEQKKSDPLGLR